MCVHRRAQKSGKRKKSEGGEGVPRGATHRRSPTTHVGAKSSWEYGSLWRSNYGAGNMRARDTYSIQFRGLSVRFYSCLIPNVLKVSAVGLSVPAMLDVVTCRPIEMS